MLSVSEYKEVIDKIFGYWNIKYEEEIKQSPVIDNLMNEYKLHAYYNGKCIATYSFNNDMKPEIIVYGQRRNDPDFKPKYKFTLKRCLKKANYTELHESDVLWKIYKKTTDLIKKHYSSMYVDYIKVFVSMAERWDDKWLVKLTEELNIIHEKRVKANEEKQRANDSH